MRPFLLTLLSLPLTFLQFVAHTRTRTVSAPRASRSGGWGEGRATLSLHSVPTLGPGHEERGKEAARRSPPLSGSPAGTPGPARGRGTSPGLSTCPPGAGLLLRGEAAERLLRQQHPPLAAPARILLPGRETHPGCPRSLPGQHPAGRPLRRVRRTSTGPQRRRAGGTPGCTAEPPQRPAPYQIVVLLIIAHEIILHVRHLGRRTGGGRRRGRPLLPEARAALPNVAPLRPEPAAARASPAPGPGRSEPNPRRPAAGSLPLVATGPWQRRPGGAWALRAGTSGAGAGAARSAPCWRRGRLPWVRMDAVSPGSPRRLRVWCLARHWKGREK